MLRAPPRAECLGPAAVEVGASSGECSRRKAQSSAAEALVAVVIGCQTVNAHERNACPSSANVTLTLLGDGLAQVLLLTHAHSQWEKLSQAIADLHI
jgi:hypothetical protein